MRIYTGYFAVEKKYPSDIVRIAICRSVPKWFDGYYFKLLAPSWDLLNDYREGIINWEQYTERFNEETLSQVKAEGVVQQLSAFTHGKDCVLLCYEKEVCHRFLVSAWLNENGFSCSELIV